eukprot:115869-Chlamydomonas_euryale.AAC.1
MPSMGDVQHERGRTRHPRSQLELTRDPRSQRELTAAVPVALALHSAIRSTLLPQSRSHCNEHPPELSVAVTPHSPSAFCRAVGTSERSPSARPAPDPAEPPATGPAHAHRGSCSHPTLYHTVSPLRACRKEMRWDAETVGCSPSMSSLPTDEQRLFADALAEVATWLAAPPNAHEFLIIDLDNQLDLLAWNKTDVLLQQVGVWTRVCVDARVWGPRLHTKGVGCFNFSSLASGETELDPLRLGQWRCSDGPGAASAPSQPAVCKVGQSGAKWGKRPRQRGERRRTISTPQTLPHPVHPCPVLQIAVAFPANVVLTPDDMAAFARGASAAGRPAPSLQDYVNAGKRVMFITTQDFGVATDAVLFSR